MKPIWALMVVAFLVAVRDRRADQVVDLDESAFASLREIILFVTDGSRKGAKAQSHAK